MELGSSRRQTGLGGVQVGFFHAGIQAQQQLIRLDLCPGFEADLVDGACQLTGEGDPLVRLDEADRFYGGDPVLRLGHHGGHRELWLGSIGHELCNLLLFEHIEADDTAEQGECYQQHDGHPLFHEQAPVME